MLRGFREPPGHLFQIVLINLVIKSYIATGTFQHIINKIAKIEYRLRFKAVLECKPHCIFERYEVEKKVQLGIEKKWYITITHFLHLYFVYCKIYTCYAKMSHIPQFMTQRALQSTIYFNRQPTGLRNRKLETRRTFSRTTSTS